jgi:hypothetical protein
MNAPLPNEEQFAELGYEAVRKLDTGEWAGLMRFMFTTGLVVGLDSFGYRTRFCFKHRSDALASITAWNGSGDPPGPWIKEKGRVERSNPRTLGGVPIVTEPLSALKDIAP